MTSGGPFGWNALCGNGARLGYIHYQIYWRSQKADDQGVGVTNKVL